MRWIWPWRRRGGDITAIGSRSITTFPAWPAPPPPSSWRIWPAAHHGFGLVQAESCSPTMPRSSLPNNLAPSNPSILEGLILGWDERPVAISSPHAPCGEISAAMAKPFPQDVEELLSYFGPAQGAAPRAIPGTGLHLPIYLLGSSTFSAELAAEAFRQLKTSDSPRPLLAI